MIWRKLWRILRGWLIAKFTRHQDPLIAHRERMEEIDREHREALWGFDCEPCPRTSAQNYNSLIAAAQNQAGMYGNSLNSAALGIYGSPAANQAAQNFSFFDRK